MANFIDVLLIDEGLIKSTTNISDNVSGEYILPAIKLAQDIDLESVIGSNLREALQKKVVDGSIAEDNMYKTLLDNYIQPYLTYCTIVHLIPNISWKIANAGVLTTSDEKMSPVSSIEVDKVKAHYKHLSDVYKDRLQRFLCSKYINFKELHSYKSCDEIRANLYSSASCNLNLGGARGRRK